MGKYDHITELTGSDDYASWRRTVTLALQGEGLWNHCSTGTDPNDFADFASDMPKAAVAATPTDAEKKAMIEWIKEDAQAKGIICRRISPVVQSLLGESLTARQQWDTLSKHFGRLDMTSQFELRDQLFNEKLKDADDASRYIGVFENGRRRFAEMGVVVTEDETIYLLLHGLPKTTEWLVFRRLTYGQFNTPNFSPAATTSSPAPPPTRTFVQVASALSEEANRIRVEKKSSGPGSEYANATTSSSYSVEMKVNPKTGVRIHRQNPKGVSCENAACAGLPRSLTHDLEHCLQKGGGMENKAPWGRNNSKKSPKKEVAAAADGTSSTTSDTTSSSTASEPKRELSCAVIEELNDDAYPSVEDIACIAQQSLSTILDSGTTSTLITDRQYFWTYSHDSRVTVKTANHGKLPTMGRGDCVADLTIDGKVFRLRLTDCLHAPGALVNLLSVGRMLKKGWACNFSPSPPRVQLVYDGSALGEIPMTGNLFFLELKFILPSSHGPAPSPLNEMCAFARVPMSFDLWHARLGHVGGEAVRRLPLFAKGVKLTTQAPLSKCEACIMAKHPRKPYPPSSEPRAAHMLDLIHSDLCGPFPTVTPHGKHYFVVFLDDHTNLLNLQLLATKDQALAAWEIIKARWENHSERAVKVFRSDNGGEFVNAAFTQALLRAGVERQLSAPYAHQQNGKAERAIRTIEGRMLAMLEMAALPPSLWGEAALTACYLWNRSESSVLPPATTPYELVNGKQPDLSHLRVFGSRCFACIPTELQVKLGPHSRHEIFVGYPEGTKGYRLRDKTGTFFVARDVIFDENMPELARGHDSDSDDDDHPSFDLDPTEVPLRTLSTPSAPSPVLPRRSGRSRVLTEAGQSFADEMAASRARRNARALRTAEQGIEGVPAASSEGVLQPPVELHEDVEEDLSRIEPNVDVPEVFANVVIEEQANISIRSDRRRNPSSADYDMKIPPATYDEAILRPDRDLWLAAMKKELDIMKEMSVYKLTTLPAGRKAIGNRWVLEFKEDNKGGPTQKARLVAQGFSQIPGVDYGATFAPVLKTASVRLISALACKHDWELDSFDAKRAFLWGVLKEEIFMRQPKGFESGDWKVLVWLMLRTIYGLKQSAMEWYEQVRAVMEELGFQRCAVDHAVFTYDRVDSLTSLRIICIIGFHVDDGLGTSNSSRFLKWVKGKIDERFGIKDLGAVTKFLGIQFERHRKARRLWLHQGEYITYLLDEYGMLDCNPVTLPLDATHPFGRPGDTYDVVLNLPSRYRKLVGELLYLAVCTRPDISFAVNSLAQHNSNPSPAHFAAAKRLLRYLAGTVNLRMSYGGDHVDEDLHAYCDADWASNPSNRLSITGYAWFYAGGIIAHASKKQSTQALSSTEAEYMAITHTIQDGLWLRSMFSELHISLPTPIVIHIDNTGAISLSKEAKNHIRSKHIDVRYHFIRGHIERGTFLPRWLPSHHNTADILTKPLARPLFLKHVIGLQLVPR